MHPTPNTAHAPDHLTAGTRELLLSQKVLTEAITRLERERTDLSEALAAAEPDLKPAIQVRLLQSEHETAMYEICLDRVLEQREHAECTPNPEAARRRERFYRLMRGLAKAGNEQANRGAHDAHMASAGGEDWSPSRWVAEMGAAAQEARKRLVAPELHPKPNPTA